MENLIIHGSFLITNWVIRQTLAPKRIISTITRPNLCTHPTAVFFAHVKFHYVCREWRGAPWQKSIFNKINLRLFNIEPTVNPSQYARETNLRMKQWKDGLKGRKLIVFPLYERELLPCPWAEEYIEQFMRRVGGESTQSRLTFLVVSQRWHKPSQQNW